MSPCVLRMYFASADDYRSRWKGGQALISVFCLPPTLVMGLSDQGRRGRRLTDRSMLDDEQAAVLFMNGHSTDGAAGCPDTCSRTSRTPDSLGAGRRVIGTWLEAGRSTSQPEGVDRVDAAVGVCISDGCSGARYCCRPSCLFHCSRC